ncbi:hypothetical protein AALC17_08245 [Oscillospiraceae bacterium 38-13]
MCTFIGIESVTMNALIEVREKKMGWEITFDDVVSYGKRAAREFRRRTGSDIILQFSQRDQASMMEDYAQYFEVEDYISRGVFRLKTEVPMAEIKASFRWSLGSELQDAFVSDAAVCALEG